MNKFLFELGTEEIPASMIASGLEQLRSGLERTLREGQVVWGAMRTYSSPRRLAVLVEDLPESQPAREELLTGPPRSIALDASGAPTQAAEGFARKVGATAAQLEVVETDRGAYMALRRRLPGKPLPELLADALPGLVAGVTWPKNMYWRESRFRFIRPLRWFLALWNSTPLDFEFEGVASGASSRGHRFLGRPDVAVARPDDYVSALRENFVLVDLAQRRAKIEKELAEATPAGHRVLPDPELTELVAYLNEYPSVLYGSFDRRFLEIPQEVLITVMRVHQKYFALVDEAGTLQPGFLTVINAAGDPAGKIREGHQRVLKARLEDAAFFWRSDQKTSLRERVEQLDRVLFQQDLGSYREKTERVRAICRRLDGDADLDTAALLCKTDLTTEMVFEMTELQGIMGGLYARREGLPESVWKAIYEHYRPGSPEEASPSSRNGALLSLADKIDTLVGCLSVGIVPRGSSDPFALRRQALGVVRVLLDHELDLPLADLVDAALENLKPNRPAAEVREDALEFLRQRVRFLLQEQGVTYDVINAVAAAGLERAPDSRRRAEALMKIKRDEDFEALAVAFKRIRNILDKQAIPSGPVRSEDLEEAAESELHRRFLQLRPVLEKSLAESDYWSALKLMASLRGAVDRFFDDVMVLTEDARLRDNRLRLLGEISRVFSGVADISEIVQKEA